MSTDHEVDTVAGRLFRIFDDASSGREPLHDHDVLLNCQSEYLENWRALAREAIRLGLKLDRERSPQTGLGVPNHPPLLADEADTTIKIPKIDKPIQIILPTDVLPGLSFTWRSAEEFVLKFFHTGDITNHRSPEVEQMGKFETELKKQGE